MLKTTFAFAVGGIAVLVAASLVVVLFARQDTHAIGMGANVITTATSSTAVSVTASTRVLSTTTNPVGVPSVTSNTRVFASICNPSSVIVYLNMNADKPADPTHSVAQIGAAAGYNSCYEITDRNLYQGSVQASSTVGAVNVLVTEYVQ